MINDLNKIKETEWIQDSEERLNLITSLYPDCQKAYNKKRFIQKVISDKGEDQGDIAYNVGDIHIKVETKYDNGENSLENFIQVGGQFERNYRYEVDENYIRRNVVIFSLHKSNEVFIKGDETIIKGVYLKSNKLDDFGKWTDRFNGLKVGQFVSIAERYIYSDMKLLDVNDFTYFYGQTRSDYTHAIRPHKIFHLTIDNTGKPRYKSIANEFMTLEQINGALQTNSDEVKSLTFDELFFDVHRLCYNCPHSEENKKKSYQIYVNFGTFIWKLNDSFEFIDFLDENVFRDEILKRIRMI